jgi:hypothetical protein
VRVNKTLSGPVVGHCRTQKSCCSPLKLPAVGRVLEHLLMVAAIHLKGPVPTGTKSESRACCNYHGTVPKNYFMTAHIGAVSFFPQRITAESFIDMCYFRHIHHCTICMQLYCVKSHNVRVHLSRTIGIQQQWKVQSLCRQHKTAIRSVS